MHPGQVLPEPFQGSANIHPVGAKTQRRFGPTRVCKILVHPGVLCISGSIGCCHAVFVCTPRGLAELTRKTGLEMVCCVESANYATYGRGHLSGASVCVCVCLKRRVTYRRAHELRSKTGGFVKEQVGLLYPEACVTRFDTLSLGS